MADICRGQLLHFLDLIQIDTTMQLTPELVALTIRDVRDDGPEPGWTPLSEAELDDLVDRIEREAAGEPLLVFAYGSLRATCGCSAMAP